MFNVVLPICITCISGMLLQKWRKVDVNPLVDVSLFVLAPSLVVVSIAESEHSVQSLLQVIAFTAAHTALCWGAAKAASLTFKMEQSKASSLTLTTIFGNANNYGLPLLLLAYGTSGFSIGINYVILQIILVNSLGMYIASRASVTATQAAMRILKTPLIYAVFIGVVLFVLKIHLPAGVSSGLHLMGNAYAALVLLVLGIQLKNTSFTGIWRREIWISIVLRVLMVPALAELSLALIGIKGLLASVLFVQSSMPAAVNTAVLARKYGGDIEMVSLTIAVTTVISFVTLPYLIHLGPH
jgi:malate permease and related proteins